MASHAKIGDHWAPKEENTPVFEGPDRSFRVRVYVGPDDVIRQQSNNKIRGFLKIVVPKANYATGYVLEEQLEFLGGMETEMNLKTAHPDESRHDVEVTPETQGGYHWVAVAMIFLLLVAVASIGWFLYRRRSPSSISEENTARNFSSFGDQIAQAQKFLRHIWTKWFHRTDGGRTTRAVDHSFIDDLLPADFDAHLANCGDPENQEVAGKDAMPDIEQIEKLYDLVLQQFETGTRVPAVWTKAVTLAGGNEEVAKYKYVQLLIGSISQQRLMRQDLRSTE